ncbi:hypothetical protein Y032_0416g1085 [Ancylostoma ceylanicum]|uniref:Saposin B-type domain-containing protein n=1 Tax=Ancylostoma ceylanicum TaxID=53326 RepID=A0A016X1S0_9BILA|nr:hypothetical protein Y032_0416g1085 [Ancylostoma ceylanicum]
MKAFLLLVLVVGCAVLAEAWTDCNTCSYTLTAIGRVREFDIPDGCRNFFTEDKMNDIICDVMNEDDVPPGANQLCYSLIREINDKGLMDEVLVRFLNTAVLAFIESWLFQKLNPKRSDWRTYKFCMTKFSERYCIDERQPNW